MSQPMSGRSALSAPLVLILALILGVMGGVGGAFGMVAITNASAPAPVSGENGAPGQPGAQGPAGSDGEQGPQGDPGVPGEVGPSGARGADGRPGSAGAPGGRGPSGSKGETGGKGAMGDPGRDGSDGSQGEQGERGKPGVDGVDGTTGPQGPAGPQGPVGPQGPAGADGAQGPQGPAGADIRFTVLQGTKTMSGDGVIDGLSVTLASATPAAIVENNVVTLPEAGTYRISYTVEHQTASAVSISVGSGVQPRYNLRLNGADIAGSASSLSMLDVNVALVLTLRVPLGIDTSTATSYVAAQPGDVLDLHYIADGLTLTSHKTATLIVEKVS